CSLLWCWRSCSSPSAALATVPGTLSGRPSRVHLVCSPPTLPCPASGRALLLRGRDLDPAQARLDEGGQPDRDLLSGGGFREAANESLVEGADDRSVGVVGVDAEGAVLDVDAHRSFSPGGAGGSEGQAREGVDDLVHRLLEGRVTEGSGHFPASAGALRFCGGDRSVPVGVSQEAD